MATSVNSSVAAPVVPAPLVLPGLPPAAVEALRSPPAGRYVYNCPVFISNSPLAMPSTLQRVLNFEPVDFTLPAALLTVPSFTAPAPPSPPSPLLPRPPTSPPTPVDIPPIVMPLSDAREVDVLAI